MIDKEKVLRMFDSPDEVNHRLALVLCEVLGITLYDVFDYKLNRSKAYRKVIHDNGAFITLDGFLGFYVQCIIRESYNNKDFYLMEITIRYLAGAKYKYTDFYLPFCLKDMIRILEEEIGDLQTIGQYLNT